MYFRQPDSYGAIRCIVGTNTSAPVMPGGSSESKSTLKTVDVIRLDHFRGFAGYYEIPATDETAEHGTWKPGPGADLFRVI